MERVKRLAVERNSSSTMTHSSSDWCMYSMGGGASEEGLDLVRGGAVVRARFRAGVRMVVVRVGLAGPPLAFNHGRDLGIVAARQRDSSVLLTVRVRTWSLLFKAVHVGGDGRRRWTLGHGPKTPGLMTNRNKNLKSRGLKKISAASSAEMRAPS